MAEQPLSLSRQERQRRNTRNGEGEGRLPQKIREDIPGRHPGMMAEQAPGAPDLVACPAPAQTGPRPARAFPHNLAQQTLQDQYPPPERAGMSRQIHAGRRMENDRFTWRAGGSLMSARSKELVNRSMQAGSQMVNTGQMREEQVAARKGRVNTSVSLST
jgi:hypothetical protein